jgi:hypothetical protein
MPSGIVVSDDFLGCFAAGSSSYAIYNFRAAVAVALFPLRPGQLGSTLGKGGSYG